jgi:proteasome lid subunit RPN8/RPN11
MAIKVVASEKAWEGFLRRAKKAFPKEHIEAIWGEETIDSYRISDFKRIKIDKSSKNSLEYNDVETLRQKWLAQTEGKIFLGTVHTHPSQEYDTSASEMDHREGSKQGEKVMGVVVIYKKQDSNRFVVQTDWWYPQQKIDFELLPE